MVNDSEEGIKNAIEILESSARNMENFGLVVITDDVTKAFKRFSKNYILVEAAGGVVYNEQDELLLIFRQGKWDLPKGKVDAGESFKEAAVREVEEECGLKGLHITDPIGAMYHTYFQGGKRMLKRTHWFTMMTLDASKMKPQLEENITDLGWFKPSDIKLDSLNTYNSIREILRRVTSNKRFD